MNANRKKHDRGGAASQAPALCHQAPHPLNVWSPAPNCYVIEGFAGGEAIARIHVSPAGIRLRPNAHFGPELMLPTPLQAARFVHAINTAMELFERARREATTADYMKGGNQP